MPLPPRSTPRELIAQRVVAQVLSELPADLRQEAAACSISFCERCSITDEPLEDDLFGLFEGNARNDPPPQSADELPRIRLFLDNLWEASDREVAVFREEVRTTLLHELGHYLGLDEQAVEDLGLG